MNVVSIILMDKLQDSKHVS